MVAGEARAEARSLGREYWRCVGDNELTTAGSRGLGLKAPIKTNQGQCSSERRTEHVFARHAAEVPSPGRRDAITFACGRDMDPMTSRVSTIARRHDCASPDLRSEFHCLHLRRSSTAARRTGSTPASASLTRLSRSPRGLVNLALLTSLMYPPGCSRLR
jgi:hypothetical protein